MPKKNVGASVAGAGDVDSDGRPDFLLGAPRADSGLGANAGAAYAFRGAQFFAASVTPADLIELGLPSPNPFRERTTLRYRTSDEQPPVAVVWDASGRRQLRIELGATRAGSWVWNGTDQAGRALPAGVYWLGFERGEAPRRVVLTR